MAFFLSFEARYPLQKASFLTIELTFLLLLVVGYPPKFSALKSESSIVFFRHLLQARMVVSKLKSSEVGKASMASTSA